MKNQQKIPVLPKEAYTSQDWFEQEQQLIFGNSWQFAGFIEDLKDAGDYLTVQCGAQNIVVVKSEDGQLRAFHNLCRHRGTQLLRATGKKRKVLTCPYHDWTYNLTGQLISVPEKTKEFPDLDMKQVCLHKASVATWRGMLWVHPNPDAPSINTWFADCEAHLGPHDPARLIEYADTRTEHVIKANWKIVVENYIDVYHLSHLHSQTLNMYNHSEANFQFIGDHYVFWEPLAEAYHTHLDDLIPFKRIAEVKEEHLGAYVPWLFPALGLSETESTWSIFQVIPIAPDQTKVITRTKMEPMTDREYLRQKRKSDSNWEKLMPTRPKYENMEADDPMASGDFFAEDVYVCEQLQKSLNNPLFEVLTTAEYGESPIRQFQQVIEKWVLHKRKY